MGEKRKISISSEVSNYIESLARTSKENDQDQISWSMHINKMLCDYISIVQSNLPESLSPQIADALVFICQNYIDDLYKINYRDDLKHYLYNFYFNLEKESQIPPYIKSEFLDHFMEMELTHIEALSILHFLKKTLAKHHRN
ncbi:TPA: hypothetical protein JH915_003739 [Acinetobacter baumannii]|nr:hypothetical protein [Acinetobacter baumannii]